jgi:hypothetical protein
MEEKTAEAKRAVKPKHEGRADALVKAAKAGKIAEVRALLETDIDIRFMVRWMIPFCTENESGGMCGN